MMRGLVLDTISKCFASARRETVGAVAGLDLAVQENEFVVILGPSGCGKTTTLRLIAGLEKPDAGTIWLDGKNLEGVPARDRDVAMVFQNHALLPHLTVFENMAFGLMLRRTPRQDIERRVRAASEALHLGTLLERKPPALSGGECQRVALGRALVRQPRVFLFDEPLSNLDAPLRLQLRAEISALHRRGAGMTLYVTHDQAEAMALADRLAVMKDGALQQSGSPMEIYRRPATRFVAAFIGSPPMNFFEGSLAQENGSMVFRAGVDGRLALPLDPAQAQFLQKGAGRPLTLGLRPEQIAETMADNGARVMAAVERVEAAGAENFFYCSSCGVPFVARMPAGRSARNADLLALKFDLAGAQFFDPATGKRLE
jgi:multiple sugar transport system ATP-binding protein